MEARLNLSASPLAAKSMRYLASASRVIVKDSTLPATTQDLVMLRASQINGCGFCTDMHTKDLAHAGETSARINLVAAWREATVFTDAERAALVSLIALINAANRLNVIVQQPAGDHQPGQFG
ncbi:carboxymuconolactone decarboxylase family protein [Nonomuraea purpurea]|uniref:Carboxymuconolactone decarboxylase family protein n=1 Tax=Nonomuraea purpurea TaxID=1849276 RepID=A0ABV8GJY7_9ACTN